MGEMVYFAAHSVTCVAFHIDKYAHILSTNPDWLTAKVFTQACLYLQLVN